MSIQIDSFPNTSVPLIIAQQLALHGWRNSFEGNGYLYGSGIIKYTGITTSRNCCNHLQKQIDPYNEAESIILTVRIDYMVSGSIAEESHNAPINFHHATLLLINRTEPQRTILWTERILHKCCTNQISISSNCRSNAIFQDDAG